MYHGKLVFAQIMEHWPVYEFQKCVSRYGDNYKSRGFSCNDQFLCMSFAQLTFRESLRDIESSLRYVPAKTLSSGLPWSCCPLHFGRRKLDARLAHLRRFRSSAVRHCASYVRH